MPAIEQFPAINASLNALSLAALLAGYAMIKSGRRRAHAACMIGALLFSAVFLGCYLYYHYHAGSTPFEGRGAVRAVYFFILITHIVLAATVPFLAGGLVWHAARRQFSKHARLARWAWPVWVYVSATGIIVYVMLYRMGYSL